MRRATQRPENIGHTNKFLSTPSAGRATITGALPLYPLRNFYPRPPRGGRPNPSSSAQQTNEISIHALRGEGDQVAGVNGALAGVFLSTPSAGRATFRNETRREEHTYFYPRPPRGGRPGPGWTVLLEQHISIHALRGEGDGENDSKLACTELFLSTPSARRATLDFNLAVFIVHVISIHALRKEGDPTLTRTTPPLSHFYPRPPRGGRRLMCFSCEPQTSFLSTPSARRATVNARKI